MDAEDPEHGTYQAGTKCVQMFRVSFVIWKTLRRQSAAELLGGRYPKRIPCSWYPCKARTGTGGTRRRREDKSEEEEGQIGEGRKVARRRVPTIQHPGACSEDRAVSPPWEVAPERG